MRLHFYMLILSLLPAISGYAQTYGFEVLVEEWVLNDCYNGSDPTYEVIIDVSGVPNNGDVILTTAQFWIEVDQTAFDAAIYLTSPSGSTVVLADGNAGSWPDLNPANQDNIAFISVNDCGYWPAHNSSFIQPDGPGGNAGASSLDSWQPFDNENPNGQWKIEICGAGNYIWLRDVFLGFRSFSTAASTVTPVAATSCNASDGKVEFIPRAACENEFFAGILEFGPDLFGPFQRITPTNDPANYLFEFPDLPPGIYTLRITRSIDSQTPDPNGFTDFPFTIEAPDANQTPFINCPPDRTVNQGEQFTVQLPDAGDECGPDANVTLETIAPDGTIGGPPPNWNGDYILSQLGTYRFIWTVVTLDPQNEISCEQWIQVQDDSGDPCELTCPDDVTLDFGYTYQIDVATFEGDCGNNPELELMVTRPDGSTITVTPTTSTLSVTFSLIGDYTLDYSVDGANVSCTQTITIQDEVDPCSPDNEPPTFVDYFGCNTNLTLVLDDQDQYVLSWFDPLVTDNCTDPANIVGEYLGTTSGGTTFQDGNTTNGPFPMDPGNSFNYFLEGAGTFVIQYTITDEAGNQNVCLNTFTLIDPSGPCDNDNTDPTLTNCQPNATIEYDGFDRARFTVTAPDRDDNCGIAETGVTVQYAGGATDENGQTTRTFGSFNSGASQQFTIVGTGSATFTFTAADAAGNISSCSTVITATDGGSNPDDLLFNLADRCVAPGSTVEIPVTVNNFNNIGGFSFDLRINGSGLEFVGLANPDVPNAQSNVLGNGDLRVIWTDPNGNDIDLANGFRLFNVVVSASGGFSQNATITGRNVDIFSASGGAPNGSVSSASVCVQTGVTPVGFIGDADGDPHQGVQVNLIKSGNTIDNTTTNANGAYSFGSTDATNIVRPTKNDEIRKGISVADVARINRHILQIAQLGTPYNRLAADVNKDGRINVADVALTRRVFLQVSNSFPNNTSWRFIPKALDISANPLDVNIPNQIELDAPGLDHNNVDFVSVKVGDVDNSALLTEPITTTSRQAVTLTIPDTMVTPSSEIRIPVRVTGGDAVTAMSMEINYDPAIVSLSAIESSLLPGFSGGNWNDLGGQVIIAWDHPQGSDITAEGTLMTLVFSNEATTGMSALTMDNIEMYDPNFNLVGTTTMNGSIEFGTSSVGDLNTPYQLTAMPNPFSDEVNFVVELSKPQKVSITLTDVSGKTLKYMESDRHSNHVITIDDLDFKGTILAIVEGEDFREVLRLVRM